MLAWGGFGHRGWIPIHYSGGHFTFATPTVKELCVYLVVLIACGIYWWLFLRGDPK